MAIKDEIAQIRKRMEKAIDDIRKELASIRTGRASISILDNIQVEYYGVPTPINQVAQLGTPEPTLITVQPYDASLVGPRRPCGISIAGDSLRSSATSARPTSARGCCEYSARTLA